DSAGNLLTGHTVDTSELLPGTYQLVVGANWDGAQQTAYQTMKVQVVASSERPDAWTAYGAASEGAKAVDDLKRGLSAEAIGNAVEAERLYAKALEEGPNQVKPFEKLAALFARRNESDKLAGLSQKSLLRETAG